MTAGRLAPGQVAENCALQDILDITRHGNYFTGPAYSRAVIDTSPSKIEYMYGVCSEKESPCHGSHPVFIRGEQNQPWMKSPRFQRSRYLDININICCHFLDFLVVANRYDFSKSTITGRGATQPPARIRHKT